MAVAAAIGAVGACNGGAVHRPIVDGSMGSKDAAQDQPGSTSDAGPAGTKNNGEACTQGNECGSGNCSDGVCCNTACAGTCVTCAASGSVGVCVPADVGTNPRGMCTDQGATSCGEDGVCDGAGACEKYAAGVVCQSAGCTGSSLLFAGRCDGNGTCAATPSQACTPYVCGATGQCKTTCTVDADCTSPNTCQGGSCGKKPIGAGCGSDGDCNSGFCAQGVCCSTACTGTCKSCAVVGSAGSCTNVPAGQDPLVQCATSDPSTCQTDGACDGAGACRLYASGTVCGVDSCTGGTEMLAGRCDGKGTCGTGALLACAPYVCGPADCLTRCTTDADCSSGNVCNGGSAGNGVCGKKVNGVACLLPSDCASGFCEQGVCCNTGCEATCLACNLTGTVGTCTPVPNGADPLNQCATMDPTTCGTDGSCNGAGACRNYSSGTVCGSSTCVGSTLTPASRCDGAGTCAVATSQSCAPYLCGPASACLTACDGTNTNCLTPNVCNGTSCGKFPIGAACALGTDCNSGFCAQGVCCNTACAGTCQSCALTNSAGTCTNVPAGQDPLGQCATSDASTCGLDGFCNGAAACERYAAGTQCAPASCTGSTFTPPAVCNGTGTCGAPVTSSCGAFACDTVNNVCKTTCAVNGDCTTPNICNGTTCTLQQLGTACTTAAQCASAFCQQGVCCASACSGGCASCDLAGTVGACTNVTAGTDPLNACTDSTPAKCGNNGLCDGSGKCAIYAKGTICTPATCSGVTFTPAATCDGAGTCQAVTSSLCTPFGCGASACNTTCATAADCAAPNSCANPGAHGSCGLLSTGAACTADNTCNSGHCQQGVCCLTACTASCKSCATAGSPGTCVVVPAGGADPQSQCVAQAASTCGTTGLCDGNGGCQKFAAGTTCIAASCSATTEAATAASTCSAANACVTPAAAPCTPYICGAAACKTTCTTNADCISAAFTCSGGVCIKAANITVQTENTNVGNNQFVYFNVQIINNGPSVLPLSSLTIRYWYTYDTTPIVTQTSSCTFANPINNSVPGFSCGQVTSSFVAVTPAKTGADFYYQLAFTAGNLPSGGMIQVGPGFNKNDFSTFNRSNDYSFNSSTTFTTTTTVTAYLTGPSGPALIYGVEPQ